MTSRDDYASAFAVTRDGEIDAVFFGEDAKQSAEEFDFQVSCQLPEYEFQVVPLYTDSGAALTAEERAAIREGADALYGDGYDAEAATLRNLLARLS